MKRAPAEIAAARAAAAFRSAGVSGRLHAVDLASDAEVAVGADDRVVLASVFKVALVTALFRRHDAGELDVAQRVEIVSPTRGATGVSAMRDPAQLSLRDLAYLAIAVSDNGAADALFDVVGEAALADVVHSLGLRATRIAQRCRDMADALVEDTGADDVDGVQPRLQANPRLLRDLRVRDPAHTNASTPRDMTRLLAALWSDVAATPQSCAEVRRLMRLQVWPHRLASGFAGDAFAVAGKTGTLPGIRNEIGVVEDGSGRHVAVAVFTTSDSAAVSLPQADRVIGTAARIAVDALRSA